MNIYLKCVPPSVTAQQKRATFVGGKPVFWHDKRMQREVVTWTTLLHPYQIASPLDTPLTMTVCLVWPHTKATPKRDRARYLPKVTKPDVDDVAKHLIDQFAKLRFITDDAIITRVVIEKWRGPEASVGIRIRLEPHDASSPTLPEEDSHD